ncbi:MAG: flagellar assembly protein FliW [Acidobacteriota bacterium]
MSSNVALDGVVTFAEGLPGFENCRQFVVVGSLEMQPFTVVQGLDSGGPSFVAIDPRRVTGDYATKLERVDLARLGSNGQDPLLWLAIVGAQEDGSATANLRAPLVINPTAMRGIQLIGVDSAYPIDHPLQVG